MCTNQSIGKGLSDHEHKCHDNDNVQFNVPSTTPTVPDHPGRRTVLDFSLCPGVPEVWPNSLGASGKITEIYLHDYVIQEIILATFEVRWRA